MVYSAVTAFIGNSASLASKILVTAILKGGCNMSCPFCIIGQRGERHVQSHVTEAHLVELRAAIARRGLLGGAAIVGDEPLQAHCWPTAKAFLSSQADSSIPTAVITNGYNLIDYVEEVRELKTTKILLSLDGTGTKHDTIRRKPGAFERISEGIRFATTYPEMRERMALAAILMPGNLDDIGDIIDFAAASRVPQVLLSPLLTSGRNEPLAVHPKVMREAWKGVPKLLERAEAQGVWLRLSDEFAVLGDWERKLADSGVEIVSPKEPARVLRVDAAGRVETLASMHAGVSTGLELPADMAEIDSFVDALIPTCFAPVNIAA